MIAFLVASLLPSALLAALAFKFASDSMHVEIEQSLQVEAATLSQDIDKMLFERLQNARTWSRLEVMQEIQINDVDKRLSNFLGGVKSGYRDVYEELSCSDVSGRVIASSVPASIGRVIDQSGEQPFATADDASIRIEPLRPGSDQATVLPIDADIASMFKAGKIGQLQLLFNWAQIYRILDQAGQGGRLVIVVDQNGKIIAASSTLRDRGILSQTLPRDWLGSGMSGIANLDGSFLHEKQLTIGFDRSRGFQHFPGFGWTTIVIQPSRLAFAPIRSMASVFVLLLVLTSTLAMGFSVLIAGRIAQPIASLTQFTRDFVRHRQLTDAPVSKGGEVGELTDAFVQTMHELEQSRADLVRASKLAALGEMSAVMAHEIRTPIGILRSSAQMLAREPGLSDDGRELTSFIGSETERLSGMVTTLLDSTRTRAPNPKPNDLHELIRLSIGLLAIQAQEKNITVTGHLDSPTAVIECDAEQMTQVLLNLIQNALQILPKGGRVSISSREQADRRIIEIADDGPGIAADALPRVFEPFFSKRDGGFGLGLSVVHHIVAAHGGEIAAGQSSMGGALFTISLPHSLETS
jgi:signal transduction histidine kinase